MKEINKQKFEERKKSSRYTCGFRYDGNTDKMEIVCTRNQVPRLPDDLTDEDLIILSQLAGMMSEEINIMLCKRDLLPDELKRLYITNEEEADA